MPVEGLSLRTLFRCDRTGSFGAAIWLRGSQRACGIDCVGDDAVRAAFASSRSATVASPTVLRHVVRRERKRASSSDHHKRHSCMAKRDSRTTS
jgi:hypothetical protein